MFPNLPIKNVISSEAGNLNPRLREKSWCLVEVKRHTVTKRFLTFIRN